MTQIRILNQSMVKEVLSLKNTIETVEAVYRGKAEEKSTIWPMIFYEFEPGVADMDIKSGYMKELGIYGLKLVSWYGQNPPKNLPALYGTTMVFDSATGAPVGIVDAEYITGMRTGAAGAIGSKWLAKNDSENLLMIGTGHQALFQILSHIIAVPSIKKIRIFDPIDEKKAKEFAEIAKEKLKQLLQQVKTEPVDAEFLAKIEQLVIESSDDLAIVTGQSDIIITATPSRKPIIQSQWVKKGTHISCVGADMSGKQEVESELFTRARVFVDDRQQAISVGETESPIKEGVITEADIVGEIGEVLIGSVKGRLTAEDITIYDTTGIALQDLAVTKQVLDKAQEYGIGQTADL